MKMLSEKTYPFGLGILTALFATNFFEEKWVGLFGIFLILGVYVIDGVRFLMAPEKNLKEYKGKLYVYSLFDSMNPFGAGPVIMQPKPRKNLEPQDGLWFEIEGKVTGKVAEKLNNGEQVYLTVDC